MFTHAQNSTILDITPYIKKPFILSNNDIKNIQDPFEISTQNTNNETTKAKKKSKKAKNKPKLEFN